MKCPKCGTTLVKSNGGKYLCTPECKSIYDEEELKNILDAEMIEEDMIIWKEAQKFK